MKEVSPLQSFKFLNPTRLIFGKDQITALQTEVSTYKKVLLVYGGGSIKRNGVYDDVIKQLKEANVEVVELSGVEANPRLTTVNKGAQLCKEHAIDFVLAVGGGSVIDCSKTIAAAAKYDGDAWDLVTRKAEVKDTLPLGTVLTLAATGSEMNPGAVITNWEINEKHGWGHPLLYPRFSILDPTYTYTVPRDQTVYGIVDIMSHVIESYYHPTTNTPIQEGMAEAILRAVIETSPKLLSDMENFKHRETIMYAGTMALNGVLQMGARGDWATHNLEHAVSAVYDIPHAGGLAILFPNWMKYTLDKGQQKTKQLAVRVFGVDAEEKSDKEVALEGIEKLSQFWSSLGAPSRLTDYDIDDSKLGVMAEKTMARGKFGNFYPLDEKDALEIYKMSL
jgi:alcohol dehydrogenase YqhD (iron-dependent ADH family)